LLDEVGLPVALSWYVDEFSQRSRINVTLDCPEELDRGASEVETAVFRIVQECLGNVHRHSSSPAAHVHLDVTDGRVHLQVSDQGTGIPPRRQEELSRHGRIGVGLRGIRERVAQLGGELQIESSPGGTTITADLPWTPAAFAVGGEGA
jgi:signal transduction histidine kinase